MTDQRADSATHRGQEIKALTAARGIAALAVVVQHFSSTAQAHSAGWIPSLMPHGYLAVDFFFVLSGFIMSYTYLGAFEAIGMRAYGPFLWKRVARICPLGWAVTAVMLLCGAIASFWGNAELFINRPAIDAGLPTSILINVLHLQGFSYPHNLNDPSWSISIEFGAYLLFPLLIQILFRGRVTAAIAFCCVGAGILAYAASTEPRFSLILRWVPFDIARCVTEFGFGMLVYRAYRSGAVPAARRDGFAWAVSGLCALAFLLRLDLLAVAIFPFVVLVYASNRGRPAQLLASPIPYFLGTISFSIYLVHHMFRAPELALLRHFFPNPVPPAAALAFAVLGVLSVLPAAALAYYTVERPGRNAMNRLIRRRRTNDLMARVRRPAL